MAFCCVVLFVFVYVFTTPDAPPPLCWWISGSSIYIYPVKDMGASKLSSLQVFVFSMRLWNKTFVIFPYLTITNWVTVPFWCPDFISTAFVLSVIVGYADHKLQNICGSQTLKHILSNFIGWHIFVGRVHVHLGVIETPNVFFLIGINMPNG